MSLSIGIVGLPNVGKSTLFNALTRNDVLASNYPFATIEPNVGVVGVPDPRLDRLAELYSSARVVPASVRFVDIAGLVRGASEGQGLGNQFLANIRECDAICQIVRVFDDPDVTHGDGDRVGAVEHGEVRRIRQHLVYGGQLGGERRGGGRPGSGPLGAVPVRRGEHPHRYRREAHRAQRPQRHRLPPVRGELGDDARQRVARGVHRIQCVGHRVGSRRPARPVRPGEPPRRAHPVRQAHRRRADHAAER